MRPCLPQELLIHSLIWLCGEEVCMTNKPNISCVGWYLVCGHAWLPDLFWQKIRME